MNDDRMKILQMIADGKISPAEGANLLRALEQDEGTGGARWLVVKVYEPDSGRVHANIRLPVKLAGKLLKFTNRFVDDADIDLDDVYQAIRSGQPGKVVEIDTEDGTRVEVYLEG